MCYQVTSRPDSREGFFFFADVKNLKGEWDHHILASLHAHSGRYTGWVEPPNPGPQCAAPAVGAAVRSVQERDESRAPTPPSC